MKKRTMWRVFWKECVLWWSGRMGSGWKLLFVGERYRNGR